MKALSDSDLDVCEGCQVRHTSNMHRHQHAEVSQRLEKIRVGWTVAGAFLAQHVQVSPTKVLSRHESHVLEE